jgi:hypothetical protein
MHQGIQAALRQRFRLDIDVATLVAGLFMLARQNVRARPDTA